MVVNKESLSVDAEKVERLSLWRLSIPLTIPYKLSFGPVKAFDTFLVEVTTDANRLGFGEATVLTGYTDETIEGAWLVGREIAGQLVGLRMEKAKAAAFTFHGRAPFTATAFITAIEMAERHALLTISKQCEVPLLAIVNATKPEALELECEELLKEGYGTFKFKIGFDVRSDLERLEVLQKILCGRARIRLDANQGYTREEAVTLVHLLNPENIELLEQPCPAGDWDSACAVAKESPVPMMMDESIYGLVDIEKAGEYECASFIKLKLMKMGGLDRLVTGLNRIRDLGMEPVLGNGVASDIGCWMEACVALNHVSTAGEMNGFLKPRLRAFETPLSVSMGKIVIDPSIHVRPIVETLEQCTICTADYSQTDRSP